MGASQPLRSPWHEATTGCSIAPLTGGCNPGRILGRVLAIDHVQLAAPAGCEDDARRFFGELLGLEEIPKPEPIRARGGVWFRVGAHAAPHRRRAALQPGAEGAPGLPGRRLRRAAGTTAGRRRRGHRRRRDPRGPALLRRRPVGQPDRADLSRVARGSRRRRGRAASSRRRSAARDPRPLRAAPRHSHGRRFGRPSAAA